ncbi:hypothetical protein K8T06_07260 [bacterium]|nr:hypothetical protein [bacterium]
MKSVFFVGIGGSGMNGIARVMNLQGYSISGSDRDRDKGHRPEFYKAMEKSGIFLYPQDGSGISRETDYVITSTAVEKRIPDLIKADKLNLRVIHRSEALANLVEQRTSVAIAGTSGKSTATGMCGWCLKHAGFDPLMINGASIIGINGPGSDADILSGNGKFAVFEADESDGSLVRFHPSIGFLTNITLDHLPMAKLREIFSTYVSNIKDTLIYNADCPETSAIAKHSERKIGFSINSSSDFSASSVDIRGVYSEFSVENQRIHLQIPGRYNIENAMAIYSFLRYLDIPSSECRDLLESFQGICRRFQLVGRTNNITVIDDFAHNPDKLRATMSVGTKLPKRCIYIFQPHGFGPIRFLQNELIQAFSSGTNPDDTLILTPVFYAGGTVNKDFNSKMLADKIKKLGTSVEVVEREMIPDRVAQIANSGDYIIVMGARDPSLPEFCKSILKALTKTV